jgi:hypothetical protein
MGARPMSASPALLNVDLRHAISLYRHEDLSEWIYLQKEVS